MLQLKAMVLVKLSQLHILLQRECLSDWSGVRVVIGDTIIIVQ